MKNDPLQPDELSELRRLLARLPDVPVPSNFTARVMQAVEREEARSRWGGLETAWVWRVFLPRAALATVAAVLIVGGVQHYRTDVWRAQLARRVASVAAAQPMPSLEALKNFDAIRRMSQPVRPDDELLALAPDLQ
ncbi:MAG TPA: hypothetical protein VFB55_03425 [Verrucomicrobiae bacterium]|nr:hypothetical protein [Verrucomicrobiae bacterium]